MATKVSIKDAPVSFLRGMALSLARTIDSGVTHNADGEDLQILLTEVIEQIPYAPGVALDERRRN